MLRDRESISACFFCLALKSMRDGAFSINFYLYNLMADERQRGSQIVQSRGKQSVIRNDHLPN